MRVHYLPLQFTKIDGGYTATDYVLKHLMQERSCAWITVTNADNHYGSEVVERALHPELFSSSIGSDGVRTGQAQMLLAPLDSRNFGALGK
jgi:hypothetical protein